jgi:hypothetical protein
MNYQFGPLSGSLARQRTQLVTNLALGLANVPVSARLSPELPQAHARRSLLCRDDRDHSLALRIDQHDLLLHHRDVVVSGLGNE